VLYVLEQADCPYRAAGLGATHCGPLNDDFETGRGWAFAGGSGAFERGDPRRTRTAAGVKQRGGVPSGLSALVTGAAAGANANANDVDGLTTATSPTIHLRSGPWTLRFRYTFAHNAAATSADYLRLSVVAGGTTTPVWTLAGKSSERNARWRTKKLSLSAWAGQDIRLLVEANDGAADNIVEAALDDMRVYRTP
jgi:aminopeptidase S